MGAGSGIKVLDHQVNQFRLVSAFRFSVPLCFPAPFRFVSICGLASRMLRFCVISSCPLFICSLAILGSICDRGFHVRGHYTDVEHNQWNKLQRN